MAIYKDWGCTVCGKKAGLMRLERKKEKAITDRLCARCWMWGTLIFTGKRHDETSVDLHCGLI